MENLKDTLSSFRISELLKELGFTELCTSCYYIDTDDGDKYVQHRSSLNNYNNYPGTTITNYLISVPTLSLAKKWLRVNHNLDIRVACNSLESFFPMIELLDEDGTQLRGPQELINYILHEEAEEAGVYHALTLIK